MLVIGLGRFGQHLAATLLELGNDVMIVDEDEKNHSCVGVRIGADVGFDMCGIGQGSADRQHERAASAGAYSGDYCADDGQCERL